MTPDQLFVPEPNTSTFVFTAITKFSIELVCRSHRKRVAPIDVSEDSNFYVLRSKGNW